MVRKCPEGHVKGEVLVERFMKEGIGVENLKQLSKNQLVWLAYDKGLITEFERDASLVRKNTTMPCYFHTHVKDNKVRELIEKYVLEYSMMQTRGSFIANMIVQNIVSSYEDLNVNEFPNSIYNLPNILTCENIIKKCFLPERWIDKNSPIDDSIIECLERYNHLLNPFRTGTHKQLICDTGWDNALNHLGTSYLGNVVVQVISSITRGGLKNALETLPYENQTCRREVWKLLNYKIYPSNKIHQEDFQRVMRWRTFLGVKTTIQDAKVFEEFNSLTWTIYCWINKKKNDTPDEKASLLPVSMIGRKFAYLDTKILYAMLPKKFIDEKLTLNSEQTGSDLQKILDLTREQFNGRRRDVRKKLKKKSFKDKKARSGKQMTRKWRKLGRGVMAKDAIVRSISTDGVGLRLCIERIPKRPVTRDFTVPSKEGTLRMATDTGRVKIVTTVDSKDNVTIITRKAYYNFLKDKKQKAYIEHQMQSSDWGVANNAISGSGGFKNSNTQTWCNALLVYGNNIDVIKHYQLLSKDQAFRKMKALRRKKAFFDQRLKKMIRPDKSFKGNIVVGWGDGQFPCTGKGEKAVPTSDLGKALKRTIKMLQLERKCSILLINEFKTTQCCHSCGKVMTILRTHSGRECLRYRLCRNCNNETIDKRRNRDVNAAKNLLKIVDTVLDGQERPPALSIPSWFWNKTTHTWVPPIC